MQALLILAAAAALLTDADVRGFVARQETAWNSGQLDRYFAGFTPDATFTDQAYVGDKPPVLYGTSTLADARAQARRALAKGPLREAGAVVRVEIAGTSARVTSRVSSAVATRAGARRLCATRVQTLVLASGRIRSKGQTDTYIRCSAGWPVPPAGG
jgi:hypothetical protein